MFRRIILYKKEIESNFNQNNSEVNVVSDLRNTSSKEDDKDVTEKETAEGEEVVEDATDIAIGLNSIFIDLDGSETVTLNLKGIGDD